MKAVSGGFVWIVAVYVGLLGFCVWAYRAPDWDVLWELRREMKSGDRTRLHPAEKRLFAQEMARSPHLAQDITDERGLDWLSAHDGSLALVQPLTWLRAAQGCDAVVWRVDGESDAYPVVLEVRGAAWRKRLVIADARPVEWTLPPTEEPEVVEIAVHPTAGDVDVHAVMCGE